MLQTFDGVHVQTLHKKGETDHADADHHDNKKNQ
jgi:hypothetical protein